MYQKVVDRLLDAGGRVTLNDAYARLGCDCINPYHGFGCGQCANCLARHTDKWVSRLLHQALISRCVDSKTVLPHWFTATQLEGDKTTSL